VEAGARESDSSGKCRTTGWYRFLSGRGEGVTFDLRGELLRVRCPTLMIGGEDDPITPLKEEREIADALPEGLARFACFPATDTECTVTTGADVPAHRRVLVT
jgi:pimeloyl-ACP methyl ester carboxylesterase